MPAIRGTSSYNSGSGGAVSNPVANRPANQKPGDIIIACVSLIGNTSSIPTSTGWTLITSTSEGSNIACGVLWHLVAAGDPTSDTWTGSVLGAIVEVAYIGVDPNNPVVTRTSGGTSATTPNDETLAFAAAVPSAAISYPILCAGVRNVNANHITTPPSGFTVEADASETSAHHIEAAIQDQHSILLTTASFSPGNATEAAEIAETATEVLFLRPLRMGNFMDLWR